MYCRTQSSPLRNHGAWKHLKAGNSMAGEMLWESQGAFEVDTAVILARSRWI